MQIIFRTKDTNGFMGIGIYGYSRFFVLFVPLCEEKLEAKSENK